MIGSKPRVPPAPRSLWAIGLLYIWGSFGWSFFVSWMPRYLKEMHQVELAQSELMSGLPLFFGGIALQPGLAPVVTPRDQ